MCNEDDRYIELAAAVVRQAMEDYKTALLDDNLKEIEECEEFFLSAYGQMMTAHHGEYIIERCKKEAAQEKEEAEEKKKKELVI